MGKNHPNVDPYIVSRVRALESLLLEKGILAPTVYFEGSMNLTNAGVYVREEKVVYLDNPVSLTIAE